MKIQLIEYMSGSNVIIDDVLMYLVYDDTTNEFIGTVMSRSIDDAIVKVRAFYTRRGNATDAMLRLCPQQAPFKSVVVRYQA